MSPMSCNLQASRFSPSVVATCFVFASLSFVQIAIGSTISGLWRHQQSLPPKCNGGLLPAAESQLWKERPSGLRTPKEEATYDILDVIRLLETTLDDDPIEADQEEDAEEESERHPGDKLLEKNQADATESYILGGY